MLLLPESPQKLRYLRMAIAFFICVSCFFLGWPFMSHAHSMLGMLKAPISALPPQSVARALLPGLLGSFLWSVSIAFLLFALVKIEIKNKESHLAKFVLVRQVGLSFLWLTVPISVIWLVAVLLGGS